MKHRHDIICRYETIKQILDQNGTLVEEMYKIIMSSSDRKERRVFTPSELDCLKVQLMQKKEKIKENNTLIDGALKEIAQCATSALAEGFKYL